MMKIAFLFMSVIMLFLCGCNNSDATIPDQSSAKVSPCEAVRIAKTIVPNSFATLSPAVGFRADLGKHGTWFVTFVNVDITFNELGWKGNAKDYYKRQELEQGLPEGIYANVTIYVDAQTGEVNSREIGKGYIVGGPGMFPDCK